MFYSFIFYIFFSVYAWSRVAVRGQLEGHTQCSLSAMWVPGSNLRFLVYTSLCPQLEFPVFSSLFCVDAAFPTMECFPHFLSCCCTAALLSSPWICNKITISSSVLNYCLMAMYSRLAKFIFLSTLLI